MPAAVIPIISLVVGVASAAYGIYSSQAAASRQEKAMQEQAAREAEYGQRQADLIMTNAKRVMSSEEAAYGAAGVKLGYGVSLDVPAETKRLAEQDALNALKDGYNKSAYYMNKGAMDADNTRAQGFGGALGSLGGGLKNFYEMYKPSGGTTGQVSTQTPFDIYGNANYTPTPFGQ
jgi:hypothetical protein